MVPVESDMGSFGRFISTFEDALGTRRSGQNIVSETGIAGIDEGRQEDDTKNS